jgi:GTP-binding protein
MAFVDELTIYAEAGAGGNGVVRWRQEKFVPKGGPAGGNGGRGGDVFVEAVRDIYILAKYKGNNKFHAERGEDGRGSSEHGANGEDVVIQLPIGSVITNKETGHVVRLDSEGEKIQILRGGSGGYGNEHFKSSINVSPQEQKDGREGDKGEFKVELELFADVGLVGLPNAGKSSLLNSLTNAKAKVGDYAFTTLDPNLGALYGYVIADIPGLIEGASGGKGLGTKFLRHIKRTKMLAHLISFENAKETSPVGNKNSENSEISNGMMKTYEQIRKELENYGNGLDEKDEVIVLTKTDVTDKSKIDSATKEFKKLGKQVFSVSLFDDESVKGLQDELIKILREKEEKEKAEKIENEEKENTEAE